MQVAVTLHASHAAANAWLTSLLAGLLLCCMQAPGIQMLQVTSAAHCAALPCSIKCKPTGPVQRVPLSAARHARGPAAAAAAGGAGGSSARRGPRCSRNQAQEAVQAAGEHASAGMPAAGAAAWAGTVLLLHQHCMSAGDVSHAAHCGCLQASVVRLQRG